MKKHVRWIGFTFIYAWVALLAAGCMNFLTEQKGGPSAAVLAARAQIGNQQAPGSVGNHGSSAPNPSPSPSKSPSPIDGTWACADTTNTACATGSTKTISVENGTMDSTDIIRSTNDPTKLSVCVVHTHYSLSVLPSTGATTGEIDVTVTSSETDLSTNPTMDSTECSTLYPPSTQAGQPEELKIVPTTLQGSTQLQITPVVNSTPGTMAPYANAPAPTPSSQSFSMSGTWQCKDANQTQNQIVIGTSNLLDVIYQQTTSAGTICTIDQPYTLTQIRQPNSQFTNFITQLTSSAAAVTAASPDNSASEEDCSNNVLKQLNADNANNAAASFSLDFDGSQVMKAEGVPGGCEHYMLSGSAPTSATIPVPGAPTPTPTATQTQTQMAPSAALPDFDNSN